MSDSVKEIELMRKKGRIIMTAIVDFSWCEDGGGRIDVRRGDEILVSSRSKAIQLIQENLATTKREVE